MNNSLDCKVSSQNKFFFGRCVAAKAVKNVYLVIFFSQG